jgi:hypothetical protein
MLTLRDSRRRLLRGSSGPLSSSCQFDVCLCPLATRRRTGSLTPSRRPEAAEGKEEASRTSNLSPASHPIRRTLRSAQHVAQETREREDG